MHHGPYDPRSIHYRKKKRHVALLSRTSFAIRSSRKSSWGDQSPRAPGLVRRKSNRAELWWKNSLSLRPRGKFLIRGYTSLVHLLTKHVRFDFGNSFRRNIVPHHLIMSHTCSLYLALLWKKLPKNSISICNCVDSILISVFTSIFVGNRWHKRWQY